MRTSELKAFVYFVCVSVSEREEKSEREKRKKKKKKAGRNTLLHLALECDRCSSELAVAWLCACENADICACVWGKGVGTVWC